jgi:hypothetical protein
MIALVEAVYTYCQSLSHFFSKLDMRADYRLEEELEAEPPVEDSFR